MQCLLSFVGRYRKGNFVQSGGHIECTTTGDRSREAGIDQASVNSDQVPQFLRLWRKNHGTSELLGPRHARLRVALAQERDVPRRRIKAWWTAR